MVQILRLGICTLIGKEILIFIIPDIGIREVAGILAVFVLAPIADDENCPLFINPLAVRKLL